MQPWALVDRERGASMIRLAIAGVLCLVGAAAYLVAGIVKAIFDAVRA